MDISIASKGKATVVSVVGSIDALTSDTLMDALKEQIERGNTTLVMDFRQVDDVSSTGLRILLGVVKESRQLGGDLLLAAVREGPHRVLEMSGFMNILKVFSDVDAAVAALPG